MVGCPHEQKPVAPLLAARLWGAVERLRDEHGLALSPVERPAYERVLAAAQTQADSGAWSTVWGEGRALSLDEAIAFGLKLRHLQVTEEAGSHLAES